MAPPCRIVHSERLAMRDRKTMMVRDCRGSVACQIAGRPL